MPPSTPSLSGSPPKVAPQPEIIEYTYKINDMNGGEIPPDALHKIIVIPICFGKTATHDIQKIQAQLTYLAHDKSKDRIFIFVPGDKLDRHNKRLVEFAAFVKKTSDELLGLVAQYNEIIPVEKQLSVSKISILTNENLYKAHLKVLFDFIHSDDPSYQSLSELIKTLVEQDLTVFDKYLSELEEKKIIKTPDQKEYLLKIINELKDKDRPHETNMFSELSSQAKKNRKEQENKKAQEILDEIILETEPKQLRKKLDQSCEAILEGESVEWNKLFSQALSELTESENNFASRCYVLTWSQMLQLQERSGVNIEEDLDRINALKVKTIGTRYLKGIEHCKGTEYLITAALGYSHTQKRTDEKYPNSRKRFNPYSTEQIFKMGLKYVFEECWNFFDPIRNIIKLFYVQQRLNWTLNEASNITSLYNGGGPPTPAIASNLPKGVIWVCGEHLQKQSKVPQHVKSKSSSNSGSNNSSRSSGESTKEEVVCLYPDGRITITFTGKITPDDIKTVEALKKLQASSSTAPAPLPALPESPVGKPQEQLEITPPQIQLEKPKKRRKECILL